ncbi:MAG: diguanylate cyclase [Acidovorax sp.]|jgi:diguanylate cyclase (GGDEF)-like protein|nr:diguanylate cyclase [Acidovorax sp.]
MPQAPAKPRGTARTEAWTPLPWCIALLVYPLTAQWQLWDGFSSFGIANALMLGLLARKPLWRRWHCFAAIALASLVAQLLNQQPLLSALFCALSDVLGVLVGVTLLARLAPATLQLRREHSPLYVLPSCLAASTATALVQWLEPGTGQHWYTLTSMLATEGMNHLLIVPMVLSYAPPGRQHDTNHLDPLPLLALLLSELVAFVLGGPGAMAFTLPAFIWCALRYSLFGTAALFALFTLWKCLLFAQGYDLETSTVIGGMAALRLELSLLWLGPLTVACSHAARNEVLQRLHYASEHDFLTRTLERGTFMQRCEEALAGLQQPPAPMAMLLLDIDHFKQVNDQHGHAMGDQVLQGFADCLLHQLHPPALVGRYGGEEFCVCLPAASLEEALSTAERLRAAVQALCFPLPQGGRLQITVSTGLAHYAALALPATAELALALADAQLYHAKESGRNRVEHLAITDGKIQPPQTQASTSPALAPPAAPDLSFRD